MSVRTKIKLDEARKVLNELKDMQIKEDDERYKRQARVVSHLEQELARERRDVFNIYNSFKKNYIENGQSVYLWDFNLSNKPYKTAINYLMNQKTIANIKSYDEIKQNYDANRAYYIEKYNYWLDLYNRDKIKEASGDLTDENGNKINPPDIEAIPKVYEDLIYMLDAKFKAQTLVYKGETIKPMLVGTMPYEGTGLEYGNIFVTLGEMYLHGYKGVFTEVGTLNGTLNLKGGDEDLRKELREKKVELNAIERQVSQLKKQIKQLENSIDSEDLIELNNLILQLGLLEDQLEEKQREYSELQDKINATIENLHLVAYNVNHDEEINERLCYKGVYLEEVIDHIFGYGKNKEELRENYKHYLKERIDDIRRYFINGDEGSFSCDGVTVYCQKFSDKFSYTLNNEENAYYDLETFVNQFIDNSSSIKVFQVTDTNWGYAEKKATEYMTNYVFNIHYAFTNDENTESYHITEQTPAFVSTRNVFDGYLFPSKYPKYRKLQSHYDGLIIDCSRGQAKKDQTTPAIVFAAVYTTELDWPSTEDFEYKTKTQIEDEIPESVPEEEHGDWIRIVSDVKCEDDEIIVEYKYVNVSVIKERQGVSNSSDSESEEENEEE